MSVEVKILNFDRKAMSCGEAEQKLVDLLIEGYTIEGQSESNGFLTYTLVRYTQLVAVTIGEGLPEIH